MADLLSDNTDFEVSKYYDAQNFFDAGLDPAIEKNKKSVFNPETGLNEILTPMGNGGYVKIGEEEPEVMAEAPAQPAMPGASDAAPAQAAAEYAQQLQEMQGSYTLDDLRAAGYTDEQISTAGLDVQPAMPERLRRVSPFGNLRIKGCLPPPRSLSQATTSFIASSCQGIHRVRLVT